MKPRVLIIPLLSSTFLSTEDEEEMISGEGEGGARWSLFSLSLSSACCARWQITPRVPGHLSRSHPEDKWHVSLMNQECEGEGISPCQ